MALVTMVPAILVVLGFAGIQLLRQRPILPARGSVGQRVYFPAGEVPLVEFIQHLADYTGLQVIHHDVDVERSIRMAAPIPEADDEVVRVILEVNGLRVLRESLPSGREVIKVESIVRIGPEPRVNLPRLRARGSTIVVPRAGASGPWSVPPTPP